MKTRRFPLLAAVICAVPFLFAGCSPSQNSDAKSGRYQLSSINSSDVNGSSRLVVFVIDTQTGETKVLGYAKNPGNSGKESAHFWLGRSFAQLPYGAEVDDIIQEALRADSHVEEHAASK
jgi:hypothetical protein